MLLRLIDNVIIYVSKNSRKDRKIQVGVILNIGLNIFRTHIGSLTNKIKLE